MHTSSFPQVTAAVLATVLALASHTVPSPTPALAAAAAPLPGFTLVEASPISTRLAPETPGCPEMGLSGRLPGAVTGTRQVADEAPVYGGPKHAARPRMNNPLATPQTLRPAMHMCVVDQFSPRDMGGAHKTVYRL
jgi:hypothetical protein